MNKFVVFFVVLFIAVSALDHPRLSPALFGTKHDIHFAARKVSDPLIFDQPIDHDDPKSDTFKQRYYEVKDHWKSPDGPILLYIAGEGPQDYAAGIDDELAVVAEQNNALVLTLEHRFFGKSLPFNDLSVPHLRYLTVHQEIEDLAYFAKWYVQNKINAVYHRPANAKNKIMLFGGSYAGMIASHTRFTHPEVFDAAWSSSGVVDAVFNFTAFDLQVAVSVGQECASVLRQATLEVEQQLLTDNARVKKLFEAEDMSDDDLLWMLSDAETLPPQYGHSSDLCKPMVEANTKGEDLVEAFAKFCRDVFYPQYCAGAGAQLYSDKLMQELDPTTSYAAQRAWWWCVCNELAYAQSYPGDVGIRSSHVTLDFHKRKCDAVYGSGIWPPNTAAFNKKYGGRHPRTTDVFYFNGSQDPWQWACVTVSPNTRLPAYVMKGPEVGHCRDLHKADPNDPEDVLRGRRAGEVWAMKMLA